MVAVLALLVLSLQSRSLVGQHAPAFSVPDLQGRKVGLDSFKDKPFTLMVFCSCDKCHAVARDWASRKDTPRTVIAFSGSADQAAKFASETGLGSDKATYLADEDLAVAQKYRAMPCPALFDIDKDGIVQYSSKAMWGQDEARPDVLIPPALQAFRDPVKAAPLALPVGSISPKMTPYRKEGISRPVDGMGEINVRGKAGTNARYSIEFKNQTDSVIHVSQVMASCGCTQFSLVYKGKFNPTPTIAPGESVTLQLKVHITTEKTVQAWIYDDNFADPVGQVLIDVNPK